MNQRCLCHSDEAFTQCCQPYLEGDQFPPTAEKLMRSRFTAFVLRDAEYLIKSWHTSTRPETLTWSESDASWQLLQIVKIKQGGLLDTHGEVEFIASGAVQGQPAKLHENSRFVREDGQWFYLDGDILNEPEAKVKVSRNAPCPCGSGKKYKRCCA